MRVDAIEEAIIKGDISRISKLVADALETREADEVLQELTSGMEEVGNKYENREYFVPEVLLSAHTMQKALELLRPRLFTSDDDNRGRVVIGTVEGDVHDIGKNLVAMFLEGAGFEVHNLGRDVPVKAFVEQVKEIKPDVVALSAMMSTTMDKMQGVIEEFERQGLKDSVKFIIGGAAVSDPYCKRIGANGYASDAGKAVRLFEEIMRELQAMHSKGR
ncbi:MAG: corrinoid protein [Candidatus Hydrothermarchaeales archaeon]